MLQVLQTKSWTPLSVSKAEAEKERRKRRRQREQELESRRVVWRVQPEVYAKERLGLILTNEQIEILYSIRDNRRTAVKAHHSLGKTFIAAIALLWWIDCWAAHIGYVTAPTWGQALGLTFKQAKRLALINKLDFDILDSGLIRDRDRFRQTERFIKALNAENGEGFQGEHTAPILIVIEEAVGVPNYIFDASEGLMTHPACRILEIANPTDEDTKFGEHAESPTYETFSYSALDHPNIDAELHCKEVPYEGAVRLQWLYEMLSVECEPVDYASDGTVPQGCFEFYCLADIQNAINGTPLPKGAKKVCYKPTAFFQGRALGDFPTEASNKVIPSGWLRTLPAIAINKDHRIQLGCDVARFGDDRTTIFGRVGSVAVTGREMRKFDTLAIADAIEEAARELCNILDLSGAKVKEIEIAIDVTGGLGAGPYDLLKSRGYKNVRGINSAESAHDAEMFRNKRSELWFNVRDRVKAKNLDISRLPMELRRKLTKELSTPMYKVQGGKKVVEDKADTKKRLGQSPDDADGFNLAFYETKDIPWSQGKRQIR
jgi:hypothetical protein